ncbi:hypothetical protein P4654_09875 [Niallia taxi]|uniref:hypothetical protein n=1 Tax=Niallia taxi TaxID=2499688 RepID=UPI002E22D7CB|nr:hypothetical protein [Niallia taxi]MED4122274.1 hypothetical protein [Niallia taxi]
MKASRIITFLVIILSSVIFVACSSNNENSNKDSSQQSKTSSLKDVSIKLEGDNSFEKNYLFFNEENESKNITLNFNGNYTENPITGISLYQDGKLVTDQVQLIDNSIHDNGVFNFQLKQYIPSFNEIKLKTNSEEVLLKTGEYSFEKIAISDTISEDKRWFVSDYNTGEKKNEFIFNGSFTRETVSDSSIDIIYSKLGQKNLDLKFTDSIKEIEEGKTLKFKLNSKSSLESSHESSYEIYIVQKADDGSQFLMNSIIAVVSPD